MKSNIKRLLRVAIPLLIASSASGALVPEESFPSMSSYRDGSQKLVVYTDVPGHDTSIINGYASRAKSDIYEIWVRSAATDNVWVQCFTNMTYNRGAEMPEISDFATPTARHAYQRFTAGWTHSYANIEMSEDSPVEVEIRKIGPTTLDGSATIVKSAVHPAHKIIPGSKRDENGRVYFTLNKPCQLVIDINGQMDDHNAAFATNEVGGRMPDNSPVHSIALYANPIISKPIASPTHSILTVQPNQSSPTDRLIAPDSATYDTLVFAPGIHNIGANFKVHPGKGYYIPGDAILYGNMGNYGVPQGSYRSSGDRIKIYGYGTVCGIQVPHYQNNTNNPEYPEWNSWTGDKGQGVGIEIAQAYDTKITGVTVIDPANFNTKFDSVSGSSSNQNLVSWVKLHSWRVNGDGFGGYSPVEDSFFRTSDDSTYVRNWRRRCTFWKDTNANIFRFVNYKAGGLDDCDIIYARWRDVGGVGSVFEFATGGEDLEAEVEDLNLTIRDIRFHDKFPNPKHLFDIETLKSYRGLVFENISAYDPRNGKKSILRGTQLAPWYEHLVFKNVTFKTSTQSAYETGTLLTEANFNDYFVTNEYVKYTLFDHPRNLTITTIADPERGTISKSPNQATHKETLLATLTATAKPGYVFTSWSGLNQEDPITNATANPMTIRMLDDRSITANFGLADIALPVTIDTPSTGQWTVPAGVFSATFEAWGGGGAGGSSYHRAGTEGSLITANTIARGGGGAGASYSKKTLRVTPGQTITYTVGAGGIADPIGFTHNSDAPAGGSSFANLESNTVILSQAGRGGKNAVAFNNNVSTAGGSLPAGSSIGDSTNSGGNGGAASSNGTGGGGGSGGNEGNGGNGGSPSAGAAGLGGGVAGAAGVNGFTLSGISGGYPGAGGSGGMVRNVAPYSQSETYRAGGNGGHGKMIVTYNTMNFTIAYQALNGSVTIDPPGGLYPSGSQVLLTAIPIDGYKFIGWSGDVSGATPTISLSLDDDKTVSPLFERILPELSIQMIGNHVELKWPRSFTGWTLQKSATLGTSGSWSEISPPYQMDDSHFIWSEQQDPGQGFYRLLSP